MATTIIVNGKTIKRPGVYALVKSGIKQPPQTLPYGNVVIIDNGLGAGFAGGAGVLGASAEGVDSVYELSTPQEYKAFLKGGPLYDLAESLFKPAANNIPGVSKVYFIKAATTTQASFGYEFANGTLAFETLDEGVGANGVLTSGVLTKGYGCKIVESSVNAGKYVIQFYHGSFVGIDSLNDRPYDGIAQADSLPTLILSSPECSSVQDIVDWCNASNEFKAGFRLVSSTTAQGTPGQKSTVSLPDYYMDFINNWVGVGEDITISATTAFSPTATVFGTYTKLLNDTPQTIATALKALVLTQADWSATDIAADLVVSAPLAYGSSQNNKIFSVTKANGSGLGFGFGGGVDVISSRGELVAQDILDNAGYQLASGGTEVYDTTAFDQALLAVKELDNTFFLSLDSGVNSTSLSNEKILDFISNESKYEKFLVIAGGYDKAAFAGLTNTSQSTAKYFNTAKVIVVHGGYKKTVRSGFLLKSQLDKAALVLGRICGLAPQTPVTFKSINIGGEIHKLSDNEKDLALDNGILTTHYDSELGYHVIQQGINSLLNNKYLVNEDGTSHDIAVMRITSQLNKEISINAKRTFFGSNSGPNRNTVTEEDLKAWLEGFLQSKTASTLEDNLIIRFGNINAVAEADVYYVTYEFVPNYPISKIIITGTILEK